MPGFAPPAHERPEPIVLGRMVIGEGAGRGGARPRRDGPGPRRFRALVARGARGNGGGASRGNGGGSGRSNGGGGNGSSANANGHRGGGSAGRSGGGSADRGGSAPRRDGTRSSGAAPRSNPPKR